MPPKATVADVLARKAYKTPEAVAEREKQAQEKAKTEKQQTQLGQINSAVIEAAKALIKYFDDATLKTEVTNQLKEIGTPDALKVADAVEEMHKTLKTHKNTDLTELTKIMKNLLQEVVKIPKELPAPPTQKFIDYSKQFQSLESTVKGLEKVIKVLAVKPVSVKAPDVKVEQANLIPLENLIKQVIDGIKGITIPEFKIDNTKLENSQTEVTKLLKSILLKPVGGGMREKVTPYVDGATFEPVYIVPENGAVPVVIKSGGGSGSQYTDGDSAPAHLTGTAIAFDNNGTIETVSDDNKLPVSTGLTQPTTPSDIQPVSVASLPLPSTAATSTKQDTGNTSLSSIDGKTKATAAYSIQAISDDGTYRYFFFEDATPNYYVMRKNLTTAVFSYAKGNGSYTTVYVDAVSGPSGSPTWGTYGAIF